MKDINRFSLLCAILCAFTTSIYSQIPAQNQELQNQIRRQEEENLRRRQEKDLNERKARLDNLQRDLERAKINMPPEDLNLKEKLLRDKFAAPHKEDLELYNDFLNQPNTGIFRLFPDYDCVIGKVIRADGECQNIFPGTWFYSFRRKDYSNRFLFDLQLKNGKLITDGFLSLGILTKLSNFSLDRVTTQTDGAKYILDLKPAEKSADVIKQYNEIGTGIELNGIKYSREAPAELGEVYLMRVIAYRIQNKFLNKLPENVENLKFRFLKQDNREDLTIAFRIVRKDADKSLTIIWKELERKKSPEVIFED